PLIDLTGMSSDRRQTEAIRIATEDAVKPLLMSEPPLYRVKLIRLDVQAYRLYLALSHIIFDGVAIYRVFLPELAALYRAFAAPQLPKSPQLPELPFQYPDFAVWQRNTDHSEKLAADITYWRQQLSGDLPVLDLPVDRARPPVQSFRGSMYPWIMDERLL